MVSMVKINNLKLNSDIPGFQLFMEEVANGLNLIQQGKGDAIATRQNLIQLIKKINEEDVRIINQAHKEGAQIDQTSYGDYLLRRKQVENLSAQFNKLYQEMNQTPKWVKPSSCVAVAVAAIAAGYFFLRYGNPSPLPTPASSVALVPPVTLPVTPFTPVIPPEFSAVIPYFKTYAVPYFCKTPPVATAIPASPPESPSPTPEASPLLQEWGIDSDALRHPPFTFNQTADEMFWKTWQPVDTETGSQPLLDYIKHQNTNGYFNMIDEEILARLYGTKSNIYTDTVRSKLYQNLEGCIDAYVTHAQSFIDDPCIGALAAFSFRRMARTYSRSRMCDPVTRVYLDRMEPREKPFGDFLLKYAPSADYSRNRTCSKLIEKSKTTNRGYDWKAVLAGKVERAFGANLWFGCNT